MGPIEQLVQERLPPERAEAVREFAKAYLRRLAATGDDDGHDTEALYHEVLGAFELAASRDGAPMAVRAFNPTRAEHGYEPGGSVVETNTEDLPFLVDSVSAELQARGLGIVRVLHPILGTERAPDGGIARVLHPHGAPATESVMHFELDRRLSPEELADLEDAVRSVLADVRRVVRDFPALRERVDHLIEAAREGAERYDGDEVAEVVAFLEWLARDNFIFLGARDYELRDGALRVVAGSGLGLLDDETRSAFANPVAVESLDPTLRERALGGELLLVSKTNRLSPVHRRARMDYVGIRRVSDDGEIVGEARMIGLFTTKAYAEAASETPVLHRKLQQVLGSEDLIEGSHDYKAAVTLFESFPKDELFAAPTDDLRGAVFALLGLQAEQGRVLGRRDADGRTASIIVALPKGGYDAALLERLRSFLRRRFDASTVDAHEVLTEGDRVRVHFTVHRAQGGLPELSRRDVEAEILELARTWDDRARDELVARHGEERGRVLAKRWTGRLPDSYKAAVDAMAAADDIGRFERLFTGGEAFHVGLRNEPDGLTRIGMYRVGDKVELSQAMPTLEHLGLRVVEERPTRLLGGDGALWLQDFGVLGPTDLPLDLEECGERVAQCIAAVWRGEAESDSLNRLIINAGLDWRRVAILRAYRKYRQRIGSRFTEGYQNDVIAANPHITAKLIRLFELRNDPAIERDEEAEAALREDILVDLEAVPSLDHDRILRNQLGLIEATVRTNAYRSGRRSIAFKLSSADVPAIPQPPPLFEIYVYAPEVEGIHLRGGRIARGGLRWSDRMDYRTEVFGLMRAQMTKNAVIVPDGAKGGFYLRRRPDDPAALKAEVERGYVTFVSGLLDLTDNLVEGEVVHPEGVRVLDADDTYLVVAADKGTATFSDTANRVAGRYGFWLGDAFASGGSKGYDHKALGITARGAWESLKRHFRELEMDPAVDEFTAVGIGDMSGDVFGNGMLLSDKIRLVAAYDHRHIFIDPDPGAAKGFAERKRLFELAGSSWDDYDRAAISEGGGVWQRSAKRIELPEQARAALGIEDGVLAPTEVIRAILRAPVDVFWNGGIGTVVKASTESDAEALDRSSDAIRVDAARAALPRRGRGRQPRPDSARADRVRPRRRAGQRRLHRQLGRGRLLRPRGQPQGPARPRGAPRRARRRRARRAAGRGHRGRRRARPLRLLPAGADPRPGGARARRRGMFAYEDLMAALRGERPARPRVEVLPGSEEMAERRRAGRGLERPELAPCCWPTPSAASRVR